MHLLLSEERSHLCPQIVRDSPDRGQLTCHEAVDETDGYGLPNQNGLASKSIFGIGSKADSSIALASDFPGGVSHRKARSKSIDLHDTLAIEKGSPSIVSKGDLLDESGSSEQISEPATRLDVKNQEHDGLEPLTWQWVAGFYDGEGSILITIRKRSITFEVTFSQKYRPLLESVRAFLRIKGDSKQ